MFRSTGRTENLTPEEWNLLALPALRNGGLAAAASERLAADLHSRYAEPHRVYHDTRHIEFMLEFVREHALQLDPAQTLAVLYHDAIYELQAQDNEERSAALLEQHLGGALPEAVVSEAAAIVRDTAQHGIEEPRLASASGSLVLDIDVANMSLDYDEFSIWSQRVVDEFGGGPGIEEGRRAFLTRFLKRPRLAMSETLGWMEAPMRENLQRMVDA